MRHSILVPVIIVTAVLLTGTGAPKEIEVREAGTPATIPLPPPARGGPVSVEEALHGRESVRSYSPSSLKLIEISQLLWSAQGVNRPGGYRTAPSAGALYPLEVYLVAGRVEDLSQGVYRYLPDGHALESIVQGDRRDELCSGALGQECVSDGAAVLVIGAAYSRTGRKYGDRGSRYVHMEAGAAAQNIYLQAEALGLGTVLVGAFDDRAVRRLLSLPSSVAPLALMPVGR